MIRVKRGCSRSLLDRQAGSLLVLPNGTALSKRNFHPSWVLRLRLGQALGLKLTLGIASAQDDGFLENAFGRNLGIFDHVLHVPPVKIHSSGSRF
jgi:hypothetical protein